MNSTSGKKKFYFNLIDVLLIVAVLATAVTVVFFLRERKVLLPTSAETVEIVYQLEVSPMREEFRNLVSVGDRMTDHVLLTSLGEIADVTYSECRYFGTHSATGATVSSPYPGHITMTLTVKAEAILTENGYEINGRLLLLGQELSFRTPSFTATAICQSVEKAVSQPSVG